uniref:Uncharacterized protein n=1 Tax=Anguilla anguilla TaxID=7936 RepID=A0A0E9U7J0_ANGAN
MFPTQENDFLPKPDRRQLRLYII